MSEIVMNVDIRQDEYTKYVNDTFDLKIRDANNVHIPFNFKLENLHGWNIGIVCGASGTGKSTILRQLGGEKQVVFDNDKCLISNFDNMTPKEATHLLMSIGLSSVPTWLRPYRLLSNGEQYRARLAKMIADCKNDEIILIDEYTSVVDRNVAKSMSFALQKYVKQNNLRIILFSCHYDIIEWLNPNWIYDLNKGGVLEKNDCARQICRPKLQISMFRTEPTTWKIFKRHHYMTAELNESASCFVFTWDEKIVAFFSTLPLSGLSLQNAFRVHRLVVLPDYQGLGLGVSITYLMSAIYRNQGKTLYLKTVHPRLGEFCLKRKDLWQPTAQNGKIGSADNDTDNYTTLKRKSYCVKYVGPKIAGFDDLCLLVDKMRYNKSMENQLSLF